SQPRGNCRDYNPGIDRSRIRTHNSMRVKTLIGLGILFALATPGWATVKVVVQNGRKVIVSDGVGEKQAGSKPSSAQWLAARISRPTEYDGLISQAAANHSVDPRLVKSVMLVESGFNAS